MKFVAARVAVVVAAISVLEGAEAQKKNGTDNTGESLACSFGRAAYGLSIGVPSEVRWREDEDAPFSVCLFCSAGDEDEERDAASSAFGFMQETCSYSSSDARRNTLVQKFECVRGEFLRSYSGSNRTAQSQLDSKLGCRVPTKKAKNKKDVVYQVGFPPGRQSSREARDNWRQWDDLSIRCRDRDSFVCGINIKKAVGKADPPMLDPLCCDVSRSGKGARERISFRSPPEAAKSVGGGAGKGAVTALAIVVALLALALLLCIVNVWCCRFLPNECSPQSAADAESYNSKNDGPNSTFNTRPNTVKVRNGSSKRNGSVEPEPEENGNGRVKRPTTSTIRKNSGGNNGEVKDIA